MTDKPTPTDAELKALWQLHAADIGGIFYYARAVLAKWGQSAQAAGNVPAIADLPPLPDIDLRDVGTKPQDVKDFLNGYATEYARIALAARAPAGSVLEDAARLDWLESTKQRGHYCGVFSGKLLTRESIDAARKQGGV